jgi:hypothetical protein
VTTDKALLWTDGRYYLQAENELGADWVLMRGGSGSCPEVRTGGGCGGGVSACYGECRWVRVVVGVWVRHKVAWVGSRVASLHLPASASRGSIQFIVHRLESVLAATVLQTLYC